MSRPQIINLQNKKQIPAFYTKINLNTYQKLIHKSPWEINKYYNGELWITDSYIKVEFFYPTEQNSDKSLDYNIITMKFAMLCLPYPERLYRTYFQTRHL